MKNVNLTNTITNIEQNGVNKTNCLKTVKSVIDESLLMNLFETLYGKIDRVRFEALKLEYLNELQCQF